MAARDIMPFISPMGGSCEIRYGPMDASEVFDIGEPVGIVNSGEVAEPPDDATQWLVADTDSGALGGIAAWGPAGGAQTNDRAAQINPKTGTTFATGDEIGYWPFNKGILFITQNFWAAAAGSAVTPLQTDVGEAYQITYATFGTPDAGWGIEQTAGVAGTDVVAHVQDVLDTNFDPIRITSGTGVYLVFEITARE